MNRFKTLITVVRHGETEWNRLKLHQGVLDSPLTKQGIEQVQNLARFLRKETFQKIYTSNLGRAVQTADIIAATLKLEVIVDHRLQERNLGCLGGLTLTDFQRQYPEDCSKYLSGDPDYVLPGGESIRQAYDRSTGCFEELADAHRNESILIITHGFITEFLFRRVIEIPLNQPRRFSLKNCSLNRFQKSENGWRLDTWGEICYENGKEQIDAYFAG